MKYQHQPIYKIYSRKRIRLGFLNKTPKNNRYRKKIRKILPYFLIIFIAIFTCFIIWKAINPIFDTICEDEAKAIATRVTNEETTEVMKEYNYDSFFNIEKDDAGNVQMITANVLKVNQITSDIAVKIQKAFEDNERNEINIAMGSMTGINMLSGAGPRINIKISSVGNIDTDLKSQFITQGVNQTVHRVYLDIVSTVNILTPFSTIQKSINNQVLIAENVIMGEIPQTYYNFNGTNIKDDAMEVIN